MDTDQVLLGVSALNLNKPSLTELLPELKCDEELPTTLSGWLYAAVADLERCKEVGVKIDMDVWVDGNLCVVCLAGACLVRRDQENWDKNWKSKVPIRALDCLRRGNVHAAMSYWEPYFTDWENFNYAFSPISPVADYKTNWNQFICDLRTIAWKLERRGL